MVLDTKYIEDFVKKNKTPIVFGLLIIIFLIWSFSSRQGESTVQPLTAEPETSWYDNYKTELSESELLTEEAETLADQGKYAEAIPKFKAALDALPFVFSYEDYDDFIASNSSLSLTAQKDRISEVQGINNRRASINYSLSFAYRDGKELKNNYQNAISAMKNGIEEKNNAAVAEEIRKQIDPDNSFASILAESNNKILANYYSHLGDLYRIYEAYDLSIQTHKKAIEINPNDSDIFTWYGLALVANFQSTLGCQQFNKALQLDDTNADASKFKRQFCY